MDWLQFFSSIVGSVAWPIAVVLAVLLLRKSIIKLLLRLRRLKYGDMEAEFGEKLEEAEEEISALPTPVSLPHTELKTEQLQQAGDYSTNSAVFIAWLPVEAAILNLARDQDILRPNMSSWVAEGELANRGLIDQRTRAAIRDLRALRNIAVHPTDIRLITREETARFTKLAEKVAGVIEDKRKSL